MNSLADDLHINHLTDGTEVVLTHRLEVAPLAQSPDLFGVVVA
jgi:hypothetical protein